MLVAFQALESFVVDYGKIHSKVNESKVITQRSFGDYISNHREKHNYNLGRTRAGGWMPFPL